MDLTECRHDDLRSGVELVLSQVAYTILGCVSDGLLEDCGKLVDELACVPHNYDLQLLNLGVDSQERSDDKSARFASAISCLSNQVLVLFGFFIELRN